MLWFNFWILISFGKKGEKVVGGGTAPFIEGKKRKREKTEAHVVREK